MDLSGVEGAVLNCLKFHGNEIVSRVDDERDFLRIWRRRWRDAIEGENMRLLRYLEAAGNTTDSDFLNRIREIPPNSNWFKTHIKENVLDISGVITDLEDKLGMPYNALRQANHIAYQRYPSTLKRLFELEDALNGKLTRISGLQKQLTELTIVDLSGSEAAELQTAILNYISGVYRENAIEESYKEFITCFAEWHALHGLVLGTHVATAETSAGPLCSICTTEKISCVLLPCGHTFCNNCTQRQKTLCYICRSPVKERTRIYFV